MRKTAKPLSGVLTTALLRAGAVLFLMCALSLGQETWKGLRFGMTADQAKIKLPSLRLDPDHAGYYEADKITLAGLSFGVMTRISPRLEWIRLQAAGKSLDPNASGELMITERVAAEKLAKAFIGKYGRPDVQIGNCFSESEKVDCEVIYSPLGQVVHFEYEIRMNRLLLVTVIYETPPDFF